MTVQLPDADRAAIQHQIQHRWADTLGTPMSDAQGPPPTGGAEPATSEAAMTTLCSPHRSPLTVLIDDSRDFRDERPALVARSSQEALSLLEALRGRWIDHLWLDHDLGGGDTIRPVVDVMVQLASTGSPRNVGRIHIHTANVGAGHEMGVDLRAAGYAVVRSYSRGRHAVGKVFWPAQTSKIAVVNQLRAMAGLPSNVHDTDGAVAERALRLVTDEDEPTALDRAWGLRDRPQP